MLYTEQPPVTDTTPEQIAAIGPEVPDILKNRHNTVVQGFDSIMRCDKVQFSEYDRTIEAARAASSVHGSAEESPVTDLNIAQTVMDTAGKDWLVQSAENEGPVSYASAQQAFNNINTAADSKLTPELPPEMLKKSSETAPMRDTVETKDAEPGQEKAIPPESLVPVVEAFKQMEEALNNVLRPTKDV